MSVKNFLSYIFKDNDPTTTDLFDSNWGNGVTEHLNALLRAPHITISSDDRQAQLNLEGSNYYIGPDGLTLGYPATYLTLINMKRDANLVVQLVYSSLGIWTRTVNHNNSSLAWQYIGGKPIPTLLTLAGGWQSYGGSYTPFSAVPIGGGQVRLTGLIRNGTANQIGWLPVHLRPKMRQILTVMNDKFQPVRFDIDPDGSMVFNPSQSNPITPGYMVMDGVSYFLE